MAKKLTSITLMTLSISAIVNAQTVAYFEDFDGNTNGYSSDSSGVVAENWVDFSNRIGTTDIGTALEGYTTASGVGSETVLAGASTNNDPQVRSNFTFGIAADQIVGFEYRIRVDLDDNGAFDDSFSLAGLQATGTAQETTLFAYDVAFGSTGAANPVGAQVVNLGNVYTPTLNNEANGWATISYSFNAGDFTMTSETLQAIRFDTSNGTTGTAFEIDYFQITTVPEPSSFALIGGLLAVSLTMIRRRR